MGKDTWRESYAPQIFHIIQDNKDKPLKEIKKILCAANPGQYGHMKKTWANEYMRQLRQFAQTGVITSFHGNNKKNKDSAAGQPELFNTI
ncbi:hypothetical protein SAMN05428988_0138 [Chitinophaga sp. YR573]|uniref:hypothetical protein n=1 Tax=Chitinophaga sp. YR573 TaxID=1881040 RepID=UPI0008C72D3B|nr:hypothetical protein [Chitinophaga sp. YR573]SEV88738.1 hypothetical protein SAMN05428988_0138 [Chitinophaga sp. YR573]